MPIQRVNNAKYLYNRNNRRLIISEKTVSLSSTQTLQRAQALLKIQYNQVIGFLRVNKHKN
jgi:hypothetical protein